MAQLFASIEEQETTINMYPKSMGDCDIYTSEPYTKKKFRKLAEKYPEFVIEKEDEIGIFAHAPRDWFKISPPRRLSMTPEQRAAVAERLRKSKTEK